MGSDQKLSEFEIEHDQSDISDIPLSDLITPQRNEDSLNIHYSELISLEETIKKAEIYITDGEELGKPIFQYFIDHKMKNLYHSKKGKE